MRRTRRSHVRFNGQSHFEWCVAIVPRCNVAHVFTIEIARAKTHNRPQILCYPAENLSARGDAFAQRIGDMTGVSPAKARAEVGARR